MIKKLTISLFLLLSLNSLSQKKIPCDSIMAELARKNSLIFSYDGQFYSMSLENFYLNDIYTGDIHLLDMTKKVRRRKNYEPARNWELFLMMHKNRVSKIQK